MATPENPDIGQKVTYHAPNGDDYPAVVTKVWDKGIVNLAYGRMEEHCGPGFVDHKEARSVIYKKHGDEFECYSYRWPKR